VRLICVFLLVICTTLTAQDTLTVDRLDYRFVSYEDGLFSPLVSLESADVAGVFVPCVQDAQVELCGTAPFDVWVDGRLIRRSLKKGCQYLELTGLCAYAERDTVFLTLVSESKLSNIRARTFQIVPKGENFYDMTLFSSRSPIANFWYVGFLVVCGLLASLRYIGPVHASRLFRPKFDQFTYRLLSIDSWIFLIFACLISAFSWAYLAGAQSGWVVVSVLGSVIFFTIIKLLLIFISATIFDFWKMATWQFTLFVRFWLIVAIIGFSLLFIDHLLPAIDIFNQAFFELAISLALGVFALVSSYVLMTQRALKSLHIFVYLCTVEILPTSLVIYWFLK